jgi:hypothetical protein
VVIDGDDAWLETTLLRADWEFQPGVMSGSWVTSTPIRQLGRPRDDSPAQRLSTEGLRFVHSSPDEVRRKWEGLRGKKGPSRRTPAHRRRALFR